MQCSQIHVNLLYLEGLGLEMSATKKKLLIGALRICAITLNELNSCSL